MKITIERERLLGGLQLVQGAVDKRQAMPVLSHFLLRATESEVLITASDLEMEVSVELEHSGGEGGNATVPARKLVDIVKALPVGAEVRVDVDGSVASVRSGRSRFRLAVLGPDDFPLAAEPDAVCEVKADGPALRGMLGRVQFAMAVQDVRYYLNGMLLERRGDWLRGVATDGHRLALCELGEWKGVWEEGYQVLVPRRAVMELGRVLAEAEGEVGITVGEQALLVKSGSVRLVAKLVDGRFPEYERVLPDLGSCEVRLVAGRDGLRQALQRVGILANEKYRAVRLLLNEGRLGVQAHNPEQEEAEEELEAEVTGGPLEVGFNVGYMVEALSAIESERVELHLMDGSSSCLLRGVGEGRCRYVVMPMRL